MGRRFLIAPVMLLWLGCCGLAQVLSVSTQQTRAQAESAVDITVGQSVVPLYGLGSLRLAIRRSIS
jgi:hypothetical protein